MEYCDRGSLRDLILAYKTRKKAHQPDYIPESFIWHAFVGLADALGFLATGRSHVSLSPSLASSSSSSSPPNGHASSSWMPIVHRDIKPDNIFLRSRDTQGSTKPLYVVLSDFGLAQYEQRDAAVVGAPQSLVGSPEYHAPELAFDPFPRDDAEAQLQVRSGITRTREIISSVFQSLIGLRPPRVGLRLLLTYPFPTPSYSLPPREHYSPQTSSGVLEDSSMQPSLTSDPNITNRRARTQAAATSGPSHA